MASAELVLVVEKHVLESASLDSVVRAIFFLLPNIFLVLYGKFHFVGCPTIIHFILFIYVFIYFWGGLFTSFPFSYLTKIPLFQGILEPHPGAIDSSPRKSHLEMGMLVLVNNTL